MNVNEMTERELEAKREKLHQKIYGKATVYSTSDLRAHEAVLEEMDSRGMGVTPIEHRAESRNRAPDTAGL